MKLFVQRIQQDLLAKAKHNKLSIEKLAATFGIYDKNLVKELTETAIVKVARAIAHEPLSVKERFDKIVVLYNTQVNLSHRTSQSILLQQYSTPAPIAFLAGVFVLANSKLHNTLPSVAQMQAAHYTLFEPSAGNGLLTITANPENVTVNEIDPVRRANLETQEFKQVLRQDATQPFSSFYKKFDAVITNPPFGVLDNPVLYDTFPIKVLDHLMALRALDTMKDNGKAAIIIGGHTHWDNKGRIQAGKNLIFFNYLYSHYHVADVLNLDGQKLYSRQGTAFDVRLILIEGRKEKIQGAAPAQDKEQDVVITAFEKLYERVMESVENGSRQQYAVQQETENKNKVMNTHHYSSFESEALALEQQLLSGLDAPYIPASESCVILDTQVPDSMDFETHSATKMIKEAVGGDIDEFVRQRLGYRSGVELCKALSAEQIDAVAMAIYNIEARKQGMIIGDQTGIGKGRVAASIIRYGALQGYKPIFLTEKANLFSDIYRDLVAIGSGHLVPFIVNGKESKTDIKDEQGNIVYQAPPPTEQNRIFKDKTVPHKFQFVLATYSQFNAPEKKPEKPSFLKVIAEDNIIIMDESHNASGSSNTGEFLQSVLFVAKGVVFLSATFAKRPDNMPVYAMKTAMSDANMTKDELVEAIQKGGVALQEVLASQLVKEGQMIRRERSFDGIEVNYITLEDKEQEHRAVADNITEILRDIIGFQKNHIDTQVDEMDNIAVAEGKKVSLREGTSEAGVTNQPYFSKVFNVINQMLFSIKAETVAERAIERLKEGKKPIIAFSSTMGSFIEDMEDEKGLLVQNGSVINADFTEVLQRGLDGILRYTETDPNGNKIYKKFEVSELAPEAQGEFIRISEKIKSVSTGITISPIDVIIQKIQKAGYTVAEVTGRKSEVQINPNNNQGLLVARKRINTNDAFRQFNNNEVDVLLINQSGSTGASAHAVVTDKVSAKEVKQRVMIVLQAELNINTEVQKRGRINRTGQILKPIYDYVNSAIPAEKRLMMMLQKKLKSLDANTTSNQKQSTKILDVPDFLNKYGDKIVLEYLKENPDINDMLNDPMKLKSPGGEDGEKTEDAAHKVSGRVAVLSTKMQQDFYNEISERYNDYTEYLKQIGEYDLEVEAMNLQTETVAQSVIKVGKGGESEFGDDSILETVRANVLKKPFTKTELENLLVESLEGKDAFAQQTEIIHEYEIFVTEKLKEEIREDNEKYAAQLKNVPNEKKIQRILEKEGQKAWLEAIASREQELKEAQQQQHALTEKTFFNRKEYITGLLKFFYAGRRLNYPIQTYDGGQELIMAVFLGFVIDRKKKNPYTPSALKLRFALASSNKYLAMPASYSTDITAIIGASTVLQQPDREDLLSQWNVITKENITDRKIRHIITGNLLQAFADFKGKLVSYTTMSGETKKGILMPDNWQAQENTKGKVIVPVGKALKLFRSLVIGNTLHTNNGISIIRQDDNFKIIVPASRQKGGEIYLDTALLTLVEKNNFEKVADKMVATFAVRNIDKVVELLQEKVSASITLNQSQFALIREEIQTKKIRHFPKINFKREIPVLPVSREMELEAAALEAELELLDFRMYAQVAGTDMAKTTALRETGKMLSYPIREEQIYGVPDSIQRPPKVRMLYAKKKGEKITITDATKAAKIFRQLIGTQITVKEHSLMLLLNRANQVIGYFKISEGGIDETMMDKRIILSAALNVLAVSFILCHNHPSGNVTPSMADKKITEEIQQAAEMMEIKVLDHIIVTDTDYFSFTEQNMLK